MSAMTIRQHYVSRALIARFSNSPELKNGLVGQFDVVNGRCMRAVSPRSIGFESHFIKYDGDRMEELWGTVERPMGEVFNALRDDPSDLLQAKQSHIKDFMALHFARSLEAQRIHIETLAQTEARTRANKEMQTRLARLRYGLDMAESPSILREMADVVLDPIYAMEDHGSPFQKWVEEVFQRTREHLANYSLSLRPAPDGSEFLLGDCPAVGIAPGMNPRRRPPLFDAKALILPLSPGVAAMAYPSDRGEPEYSVDDADDGVVLAINHGQIAQSHRRVFFRPDSGHSATVRNYLGI